MIWSISLGLEKYPEYVDGNWDLDKMQPWINWAAPMEVPFGIFIYFHSKIIRRRIES